MSVRRWIADRIDPERRDQAAEWRKIKAAWLEVAEREREFQKRLRMESELAAGLRTTSQPDMPNISAREEGSENG